ncbi:undecaprenyl/decaprenyl-phosphate alpha-N-acetylglucosaminyl 1-phosphate transferase [Aerococcaceae bacterium NML191219]|nr:undecaprenyl/decaprenyl-phosphate alpha-N-acetylglucosaminyl 1-phosphate transferase [Aerococcaceae bacterium NML191219]
MDMMAMVFIGVAGLSWFLTYALCKIAVHYQWYDKDSHGIKEKGLQVPALGGMALFVSFWLGVWVLFPQMIWQGNLLSVLLASAVIVITGIIDDFVELTPIKKTLGILLAANIVYFMGQITFSTKLLPSLPTQWFELLTYVATISWIYAVTNAVNLLDGLDGLAGSVSLTSLITLVLINYYFSQSIRLTNFVMLILLTAAIIGFLPHNWYPAKIYLGDTGALFIGFMYATLTVSGLKNATFFSLLVPVVLYAVPIFDTVYAMCRRVLSGQSPTQGDREHLHHRLLRFGLPEKQVVWVMVGMTILFLALAVLSHLYPELRRELILIILALVSGMIIGMKLLARLNNK